MRTSYGVLSEDREVSAGGVSENESEIPQEQRIIRKDKKMGRKRKEICFFIKDLLVFENLQQIGCCVYVRIPRRVK